MFRISAGGGGFWSRGDEIVFKSFTFELILINLKLVSLLVDSKSNLKFEQSKRMNKTNIY